MAEVAQQLLCGVGGLAARGTAQLGQLLFGIVDTRLVVSARCSAGTVERFRGAGAGRAALLGQDAQLSCHGGGLVLLALPPGIVAVAGRASRVAADADDGAHP
ncbi:hypothetical protein ACH47C_39000 [Streptomyces rishiriensis]|uniref:hypothetical protein n=1 Tax=Streptomyces rishiriensis TaxID=68264 RepID=UPI00341050CB